MMSDPLKSLQEDFQHAGSVLDSKIRVLSDDYQTDARNETLAIAPPIGIKIVTDANGRPRIVSRSKYVRPVPTSREGTKQPLKKFTLSATEAAVVAIVKGD